MIKNKALAGITVVAALLLAACSQGTSDTATTADEGTVAEATGTKPAPFDAGPVKIAIVQNSGAGDYFQQWTNGANKQAEALNAEAQKIKGEGIAAYNAAITSNLKNMELSLIHI